MIQEINGVLTNIQITKNMMLIYDANILNSVYIHSVF